MIRSLATSNIVPPFKNYLLQKKSLTKLAGPTSSYRDLNHIDVHIKEHEVKNKISLAHSCLCTRAATSTATGDFQTATCVTLFVTLGSTNQMNLVNEKLSFRIAEGLPAEMILGYNSFRDLGLTVPSSSAITKTFL